MSYLYDSHYSTNSTEFLAIYFPFIVQYYHRQFSHLLVRRQIYACIRIWRMAPSELLYIIKEACYEPE